MRHRIESLRLERRFDSSEAIAATRFLGGIGGESCGIGGESCGIVEYVAALTFGRDPIFRETWRAIRRSEDTPPVAGDGVSVRGSGVAATDVAETPTRVRRSRERPEGVLK